MHLCAGVLSPVGSRRGMGTSLSSDTCVGRQVWFSEGSMKP